MMTSITDLYQVGGSEKIKNIEDELQKELSDLKNDIEENETFGASSRVASSVPLPQSVEFFRKKRELTIKRAMEVSEAQPLVVQAHVMQDELDNCSRLEYTADSLPLILHQFYCDRIQQLVQCKHLHMLRWKRFCEHTNVLESLFPMYQKRLEHIMSEYNDAVARARRLHVAHESYIMGKGTAKNVINLEDLMIYTRWLTCNFHATKKINSYLKVLEYIPAAHKHDTIPPVPHEIEQSLEKKTEEKDDKKGLSTASEAHSKWFGTPGQRSILDVSGTASILGRPTSGNSMTLPSSPLSAAINIPGTNTIPHTAAGIAAAAAAGGGPASDDNTLSLPFHESDFETIKPMLEFLCTCYGINMDLNSIYSTSDEMELITHVNRRFKTIFAKQEQQKTYPTYDKLETGKETWGADISSHALKKEATWLPYVQLKPIKDHIQEKNMTKLRQKNSIDELLKAQSKFLSISDSVKVQDALKDHAVVVKDPPEMKAASVTSHRTNKNTNAIWRKIYCNHRLYDGSSKEVDLSVTEFDEKETDNVNFGGRSSRSTTLSMSTHRRKDDAEGEFNYQSAMQMLGLEDEESAGQNPTSIHGGYLSLLNLRHLRIRDLKRTCLSVLNYFRSVERTLTINDGGLSLEAGQQKRLSQQNHRVSTYDGGMVGGSGGIGNHGYLHYSPVDFKLQESAFMEFSEIENHDDYYSVDEGRVHVQDQRGYYIIYDVALKDLKNLEHDLLLIATHYLEKNQDRRLKENGIGLPRTHKLRVKHAVLAASGGVDLPSYGHLQIDRFAVLLDLWTNEAEYLENKRQLIDCYLEAYQHVFDMHEKRALAQNITDIMYKRPRLDFSSKYFVSNYRMESIVLRLNCKLIKSILDKQIQDQREYIQRVCRDGDKDFGLPHRIIPKQPIAINLSRPALSHVYLLEFHPSLAVASRLPTALKFAYNEITNAHLPKTVTEQIYMEKRLLEIANKEWVKLQPMGSSFTPQIQRDLFSDVFAEDPLFMCEMGQSMLNAIEATAGRRSQKEKQEDILKVWSRLLETITLRFRLMDAAFETEVLSKLYLQHANELGFDDCHMFMRCVQFEFANFKENADQPPPLFITALQEDDSNLDRYTPSSLFLAVHELDEKHVGTFSFRTRDGYLKVLRGSGRESLQVVLMAQVVHKNALLSAVQQASICSYFRESHSQDQPNNVTDTDLKSDRSSLMVPKVSDTSIMAVTQSVMYAAKLKTSLGRIRRSPEAFMSLQLEKAPSRDVMLNNYLNKKASMGTVLKNQEEVEKLKRTLIGGFCQRFLRRISQYSLRGQIIAYLNTIEDLLQGFPSLRNSHFMVGMPGEKKTKLDDKDGLLADPRTVKRRPRHLLSSDGTTLLNLWFLPHHSEVLMMFKSLDEASCIKGLLLTLRIVASLHDILQYLCAHAKLGSSHARLGSQKLEFVTADWGGTEGISAEFREIQKQINNLEDPKNPAMVADFLALRKDVMFLEFETSIRHSLRDTFLSTSNSLGYNSVTDNIYYALPSLSNVQVPTVNNMYLPVPEPLEPRDADAKLLFPWRSFLGRGGPFPLQFWQWHQIESRMQLCLAGLKDVDRHVSNGEILGVSLLMEDVLQSGHEDISMLADDSDSDDDNLTLPKRAPRSRPRSAMSTKSGPSRPASAKRGDGDEEEVEKEKPVYKKALSRTTEPMEAYALLRNFLLLWKRLEVFKDEWGKRKLEVETIGTTRVYRKFCQMYKTDILYPTIKGIARRYGQGEHYDGMVSDNEPIVAPKGASEMEIRAKQLVKLLDNFENSMIYELRRKVSREHALVVAERGREEGNLPVDLWKKPVINERLTIAQPHIAEDFTRLLLDRGQKKGENFVIPLEHLNSVLSQLASLVMMRERSNYDNYSMFYENILRQQHQIIYQREQEIKHANEMSSALSESSLVDVQCQLADRSHELILEVTALRAKIAEMRETALVKEQELRRRVQDEYNSLIHNLFAVAFGLKGKLDEFRTHLYDQVFTTVGEVRREAVMAMSKLKTIKHDNTTPDNVLQHKLTKAEELRNIRHENDQMKKMLSKLRTVNSWRFTKMRAKYMKKISELHSDANQCKRDYLEIKLMAEEEVIILRQQLVSLKSALSTSEKEREAIQKQIDKELEIKNEKMHKEEQDARNARQLEIAKAANMTKLIHEAEVKEEKLKALTDDFTRSIRLNQMYQDKSKRDASQMRQQLEHERTLKLDAFTRVDELQTQVYDYEQDISVSRPYTSMSFVNSARLPPMRSKSSDKRSRSRLSPNESPNPVNNFPPNYQQRSLTPDPWSNGQNKDTMRTTQRPQTVGSKLRNRIAEQLLTNLQPDHHETIMQLQAWEQQYQKK